MWAVSGANCRTCSACPWRMPEGKSVSTDAATESAVTVALPQREVILGIDPGSRTTGYGVVAMTGPQLRYLGSGCINAGRGELSSRLHTIFQGVATLIGQFQPSVFAIEQAFLAKNVQSTVKLSEARAAAIVAAADAGLAVYEYTPMQIKQAVVGTGGAQKVQVQYMVKQILSLNGTPQADAADALACAICHGFTARVTGALGLKTASAVHGRWRR